ncbi:restriction endonuclease subunit S [Sporomusa acidovorans]|uniref:Type I restriction modification DNA specificity domain-containing protein n=1 Tax=Sporomusa acidovorans (strain ATCC 49682 / DSM 3132 / Mol) TaxID=1123286 RepID=A0ABZ3J9X2_SPOA4|nr:restriction endonuclease subunit S [Sporomusa acidovorans]OZC17381.1 type-1 restriction enzyme EcoKI specificity protein [Sporomusa acidovorans DSM 3132]SDF67248.1 type I restriction enzyme, S subunit [Sporomusa acidovorans]
MSKWENRQWCEVLEIINGKSQKNVLDEDGSYPYGSGGIMGYANDYICEERTVIIGRKGNINKPIFVEKKFWNVDTAFGLKAKKNLLEPKFLYYFCVNYDFEKLNTTVTIPSLTKANLLKVIIPLPPLEVQKKIAQTLDAAAEVIALRKKQLTELDHLIKATFYDMFGDPEQNPHGWIDKPLEDISDIISGVTKGRKLAAQNLVVVPYMRVENVQDGHLVLNEVKKIEVLPDDVIKYRLSSGDLLMTEGGDPDKLGRCAIWNGEVENCIHQNHIFRVRIEKNVALPIFICFLTGSQYGKKYFLRAAKQTTGIATINSRQLKKFPVLLPPLHLQNQFAEIVTKIRSHESDRGM